MTKMNGQFAQTDVIVVGGGRGADLYLQTARPPADQRSRPGRARPGRFSGHGSAGLARSPGQAGLPAAYRCYRDAAHGQRRWLRRPAGAGGTGPGQSLPGGRLDR